MRRAISKMNLLLALFFSTTPPEAHAEQISDEQKAELFHFGNEDYLVETPTRHLKPVSKSDSNISVIDAKDLKNMNAHALAEALNRIPGVYVNFGGADFGSSSLLEIQGGPPRHTRVMVMGIFQPEASPGDSFFPDISRNIESRTIRAATSHEPLLTSELKPDPSIRHLVQKYDLVNRLLGLGLNGPAGKNTIVRGSAGRGFTTPSISWTKGGALFSDPNPSLDVEKVRSFQAGVESGALKYAWGKASAHHQEIEDAITSELSDPEGTGFDRIMVNEGKIRRKGFEVKAETAPWRGFSL